MALTPALGEESNMLEADHATDLDTSFASTDGTEEDVPNAHAGETPHAKEPNGGASAGEICQLQCHKIAPFTGFAVLIFCTFLTFLPGRGSLAMVINGTAPLNRNTMLQPQCSFNSSGACPAWTLFASHSVRKEAAQNLLRAGQSLLKDDATSLVMDAVVVGFASISLELQKMALAQAESLGNVSLGPREHDALVATLRLLRDSRVQQIGQEVGRAIQDTQNSDREAVQRRIEARLRQKIPRLRQLRDELVPRRLQGVWGKRNFWALTLDPANIRAMQTYRGESPNTTEREEDRRQLTQTEVLGAVLEQGRVLLDVINICARLLGTDLSMPTWAAPLSALDTMQSKFLGSSLLACAPDSDQPATDTTTALICPLKFGAQGMDALAAGGMFAPRTVQAVGTKREPCQFLQGQESQCHAMALFLTPEVHEVAANNIMNIGAKLLRRDDAGMVMEAVSMEFANITLQLRDASMQAAEVLEGIQLSEAHKDAIIACLTLIGDPRVQRIGLAVARTIRKSTSTDTKDIRREIELSLEPRRQEIEKMRDELLPVLLREAWGKPGLRWAMTLEPENLRAMRPSSAGDLNLAPLKPTMLDIQLHDLELHASWQDILGGAVEQGRVLVHLIKLVARVLGKAVKTPSWTTSLSLVDTLQFGSFSSELVSCNMDPTTDVSINFMKVLFCPLKYGAQGLDALAAAPETSMLERRLQSSGAPSATPHCSLRQGDMCCAFQLLAAPEVHRAVVEGLGRVAKGNFPRGDVSAPRHATAVAHGLERLRAVLHGLTCAGLRTLPFTEVQMQDLVTSLSLIADPRVQGLGAGVAEVIRSAPSSEPGALAAALLKFVKLHLPAIQSLRHALVPLSLRQVWKQRAPWALTLAPESGRATTQAFESSGLAPLKASWKKAFQRDVDLELAPQDIQAGVLEEGRVVLDFIQACANAVWKDLDLPTTATSLASVNAQGEHFSSVGLMPRELDLMAGTTTNLERPLFSLVRYGAHGLDALAALDSDSVGAATLNLEVIGREMGKRALRARPRPA